MYTYIYLKIQLYCILIINVKLNCEGTICLCVDYIDIHVDTLNGVPFWMKPNLVLSCFWGVLPGFWINQGPFRVPNGRPKLQGLSVKPCGSIGHHGKVASSYLPARKCKQLLLRLIMLISAAEIPSFLCWISNLIWWNSRATFIVKIPSFGSWNPTKNAMTPRHGSSDLYRSTETRPVKHWSTWLARSSLSWDVHRSEFVHGVFLCCLVISCHVPFVLLGASPLTQYGSFYIIVLLTPTSHWHGKTIWPSWTWGYPILKHTHLEGRFHYGRISD